MARQPQVTRTIITTKAKVLCMDIAAAQPVEREVTLPRTYKDEKALMKQIAIALADDTNIKAVAVRSTEEVETLYGMTEQEFIAHAKVLPPRTNTEAKGE